MPHPYQMARQRMNHSHRPPEVNMDTPRIHWDDDEKRRVAVEAFKLLSANDMLSNMAAIEHAQKKVLPLDRRRSLAKTTFTNLRPWIDDIWAELKSTSQPAAPAAPISAENQTVVSDVPSDATPSAEDDTRTLVRWTDAEKRQLAARVYYLMGTFQDMPRLDALRKAIDSELPDNRRREISTWHLVGAWLDPMLEQVKIEAQLQALKAKEERERESHQHEIEQVQHEIHEERIEREVQARIEAQLAEHDRQLRSMSIDSVVRLFADRVANVLTDAFADAFSQAVAAQMRNLNLSASQANVAEAKPPVPPKDRLPRVTVVGLYRQQEEDIKRAFLGTVDFIFVKSMKEGGTGHGGPGMLTKSATSDLVIAMTDHAGHDVEASAKHLKIPFRRLTGSATALKRWLTEWLAGKNSNGG